MSQKQVQIAENVEELSKKEQSEDKPVQSEQTQIKEASEIQEKVEKIQIEQTENKQKIIVGQSQKEVTQPIELTHVQPPPINKPKYFYKGDQKYNWDIQILDQNACLQKIQAKILPDFNQFLFLNEVNVQIGEVNNVKGHLFYNLKANDRKGQREVSRRYTQFILFRNKLTQLWPGIILATLPNKTLIGVSQADLIRSRSRYISRFFRTLSSYEAVYYSEQTQSFLNNTPDTNISAYLQAIQVPKSLQLFQKYKISFAQQYQSSTRQDFLYRKEQIPANLQTYQVHFSKKKIDLSEYMGALRRMAQSKQNYFRAASRLNLNLLADYQDTLYRWIYGEPLPKKAPSIMQRMNLKKIIGKQNQAENESKQSKQSSKQQEITKFGLFYSQAYTSRFEDTAQSIKDYNSSSWKIYDVIKFELKQIDSVIGAIQQVKGVGRQIEHHKRTININKEQVEALNSNKKTLKTFFMDGNTDEKKTKLTNQNQTLQDQLQKLQEFYNLLILLLQIQLKQYHKQRSSFYKVSLNKSFNQELQICKAIMNFHTFEEQLFGKELKQRMSMFSEDNFDQSKAQEQNPKNEGN